MLLFKNPYCEESCRQLRVRGGSQTPAKLLLTGTFQLQLHSDLFITLFIAYMKDQSAAVSAWMLRLLAPHTTSLVSPHSRELQLALSQLLPAQADIPNMLALLLGRAAAMTTPPGLHVHPCFLPFLPPSLHPSLPPFGSHKHPGSQFISCYSAAWLPR